MTLGVETHDCLCLETCGENYLGFHDVPNALLLDLVQCVISDWQPGFKGISEAVHSVISDYCVDLPVISGNTMDDRRYMTLKGSPWSQSEEGAPRRHWWTSLGWVKGYKGLFTFRLPAAGSAVGRCEKKGLSR